MDAEGVIVAVVLSLLLGDGETAEEGEIVGVGVRDSDGVGVVDGTNADVSTEKGKSNSPMSTPWPTHANGSTPRSTAHIRHSDT